MTRRSADGWRPADAPVLAVLLGIAYASIARYGSIDCGGFRSRVLRESLALQGPDLLGNVFAYALLGAALCFAWSTRRAGARAATGAALAAGAAATLAGAALSLSMEAAQACLSGRTSALPDVVANTAGTALGWFGTRLAQPLWSAMLHGRPGRRGEARLAAVLTIALLAWTLSETAPWVPAGGVSLARLNLQAAWAVLGGARPDPWHLAIRGAQWLAVGLSIAAAMRRPGLALLPFGALAAAVLGWRLLLPIVEPPSAAMLVTLPFAALAVLTVPRLGRSACAALALAGAIVAMLAAQLEPGYGPTGAMRWRIEVLSGDPVDGIREACRFAWFAMTVVAAGHLLDGHRLRWAALAVGLLAASEWAQTGLPGGRPDLSSVAMGLAGAALAAGLLAARRGGPTRG